ncbi:6-phosphogluconolactonase [Arhodomonas sp. AD133]|uniref:6-phosphogluconolactonase n=1 Tax=Arhodomonas sp. AD133 TaxID=3415009 RepID=UPI003EB979BC
MSAKDRMANAQRFDDGAALAAQLAETVAADLNRAVTDRGAASLVVSGGRTPVPFFEALAACPLDWSRVTVTLADERWVPESDGSSNAALVREHLLRGPAAEATFVPLYDGSPDPDSGLAGCRDALTAVPSPLDVVILGMGGDGHTASLFPDTDFPDVDDPAPCCVGTAPSAPHARISLTPSRLLDSRRIILHITGLDKWGVLERACEQGPARALPIRLFLHQQRTPVDVFWSP